MNTRSASLDEPESDLSGVWIGGAHPPQPRQDVAFDYHVTGSIVFQPRLSFDMTVYHKIGPGATPR